MMEYTTISTSNRKKQMPYNARFIIRLTLPTLKSFFHLASIRPTTSIPPLEAPIRRAIPIPLPEIIPPTTQAAMESSTIAVTGIADRNIVMAVTETSVLKKNRLPSLAKARKKIGILIT